VPVLVARFSLRNTHPEPLIITFPTSQIYDFVIREVQTGTVLYRWSDGRGFTDAIERHSFAGETNWGLAVPLGNPGTAEPFPPGAYLAEAWLTTGSQHAYRAIVGFSLRHVF
jgi:hypothetical protein